MTIWLAKRKGTASRWCNFHFRSNGAAFESFIAYRTRRDAMAFCDRMRERYGTEWEVVKFTAEQIERV